MIQAHVRMLVPREKRAEIEHALRSRVAPTRAVRGCLDCRVYRELDGEEALVLVELWQDHAAWQCYARSDSFRQVLMLVELLPEPPEIAFRQIDATWDLSYLVALQDERSSPTGVEAEK
jgi:quinol monooxygenase YgiN